MNTVTEMATFQAVPVEPGDRGCEAGDMSDVMFAIAAFQLESMDIDLSAKVLGLKHLTEIKNAYRERIDDLNDLLGRIPEGEDGTRVGVQEGIESDFEWDEESGCVVDGGREPIGDPVVLDESGEPVSAILEIDEEDAPAADDSAGQLALARSVAASTPGATVEIGVTRADLAAEIERLEGKLDGLTGEGEIQLLAINQLLNKRNQVLQLASNVMSSEHQGAMGIISNIK